MATLQRRGQVDPRQRQLALMHEGASPCEHSPPSVEPVKVCRSPPQKRRIEINLLPQKENAPAPQDDLFKARWVDVYAQNNAPAWRSGDQGDVSAEKALDVECLLRNIDKLAEGIRQHHLTCLWPDGNKDRREEAIAWFLADDVDSESLLPRVQIPFTYQWVCAVLGEPADDFRDRVKRGLMSQQQATRPEAPKRRKGKSK